MIPSGRILHVVDITAMQPNPPRYNPPHHRIVPGAQRSGDRVMERPVHQIDGIVLHQTACPYGVTAEQVKAAGGDRVQAKHRRALDVAAHMTAFDTGYAVLAHPLTWYVYHANAFCARSIGIEVEGRYPGMQGGSPNLMFNEILQAARDGIEYIVEHGREMGMPLKYIWAHRQSSMTRQDDPGEELWRRIVLEFAVPTLGLVMQPTYTCGGLPLPVEWLDDRRGTPWQR